MNKKTLFVYRIIVMKILMLGSHDATQQNGVTHGLAATHICIVEIINHKYNLWLFETGSLSTVNNNLKACGQPSSCSLQRIICLMKWESSGYQWS